MTTEPEYTPPAPFPEAGFVSFQIPGMSYSVVHLPLVWNIDEFNILVASAMESAKLVKEAYDEAFPQPEPTVYQRAGAMLDAAGQQATRERLQQPQRAPQQRAQQPQTRRATDLDPNLVLQGNCPEHGVPVRPSKLEYQEIEIDAETGNERYSKYYCNSPEGRHSLWARQLV